MHDVPYRTLISCKSPKKGGKNSGIIIYPHLQCALDLLRLLAWTGTQCVVRTRFCDEVGATRLPQSAIDFLRAQVYVVPEGRRKRHGVGNERNEGGRKR